MLFEESCRYQQVVGRALGRSIIEEELVSEDERDVDQVVIDFAEYLYSYADGLIEARNQK